MISVVRYRCNVCVFVALESAHDSVDQSGLGGGSEIPVDAFVTGDVSRVPDRERFGEYARDLPVAVFRSVERRQGSAVSRAHQVVGLESDSHCSISQVLLYSCPMRLQSEHQSRYFRVNHCQAVP